MAGLMRREPREEASDVFGRFNRLLDEWMRMAETREAVKICNDLADGVLAGGLFHSTC